MGIADYGITYTGSSYSYTTPSFLGVVNISYLQTYNSSQLTYNMTFQLNVNMYFYNHNTLYVYWIQDVAFLDTSTRVIYFLDNIWNLSASSASMYNSSVLGNGTVAPSGSSHFYYSFANATLPGQGVTLNSSTTFYLKTNTFMNSKGFPEVDFLYNDGHGWVTYDNAQFIFATSLSQVPYFLVDGNIYEPNGYSFYNAELIMGGPGNGSQTEDLSSRVGLILEYYNGHNFQAVSNAFNFGSDTAEGIFNALSDGMYFLKSGQPFAYVTNGSGSLGMIFYSSELASLAITTNISVGDLYIGGVNVTRFFGGIVNVTVYPGQYSISVYDEAMGKFEQLGNVSLLAGQHVNITHNVYRVEFTESGLPSGAAWYVNITGLQSSGPIAGSTYVVDLQNGSYIYTISSSNKNYYPGKTGGTIYVNGGAPVQSIIFIQKTYSVLFTESGLPAGDGWYINLTNGISSGRIADPSYGFNLSNGTYSYSVGTNDKIYSARGGTFVVNGENYSKSITFVEVTYNITFVETGLPAGANWHVYLSTGLSLSSSRDSISVNLVNGSYSYSVGTYQGFSSSPQTGTLIVSGPSHSAVLITFTQVTYLVTFSETGLPSGMSWYLNFSNGSSYKISSASTSFELPNGTYSYVISNISGFSVEPSSGSVIISGNQATVSVAFTSLKGFLEGTMKTPGASISINGTVYPVTNGRFNISLNPGTYVVHVSAPGYSTYVTNVSISSERITSLPIQQLNKPQSSLSIITLAAVIIFIVAILVLLRMRGRIKK
jgi:hypothetical protein